MRKYHFTHYRYISRVDSFKSGMFTTSSVVSILCLDIDTNIPYFCGSEFLPTDFIKLIGLSLLGMSQSLSTTCPELSHTK